MKSADLKRLGIPDGKPTRLAFAIIKHLASEGAGQETMEGVIAEIMESPDSFKDHLIYGDFVEAIAEYDYVPRLDHAPYKQWGEDLEAQSVQQMHDACSLPVAVAGALMPDAHLGYGLPIGGVLATDNAVIPYAVGVDIACRMRLSVYDLPVSMLSDNESQLEKALEQETCFGVGGHFEKRREHDVMDEDWNITNVTKDKKDKAWAQLGTSGSGNHFAEFGVFTIDHDDQGIAPGKYLALLSHSGSRGAGAAVADHYSKLARSMHSNLPKDLAQLAWLNLDQEEGQEYWAAMELMGQYAAGNHACIHRHVAEHLGAEVLYDVENHHNFAWKEQHLGKEVIVHRKGATPAGEGMMGIIPGSMASPAFVVRGRGNPESLNSASHGAGRVMSRMKAKKAFDFQEELEKIRAKGVKLLSAGVDEVPGVYKDIHKVMESQQDLVEKVAQFDPKLVKMAPGNEKPED